MGNWFRGLDRGLVIFGLAVAFLSGAGLDETLRRLRGERWMLLLVAGAAVLAMPLVLNIVVGIVYYAAFRK